MVKNMVRRLCSCIPWRSIMDQGSTYLLWRIPCCMWMPKRGCNPYGKPIVEQVLDKPMGPWTEEPTLYQVCWQDLCPHERAQAGAMENPAILEVLHSVGVNHPGAVQGLQPVGMINAREAHEGLSLVGGTPTLE
ncbi:hypothetical protein DUI87_18870 [Hirundo rustica rustica]|uniref:Uncharacterized protein n=1 Tax=Hirundo rustica rustica TaxID=333673 RepID=A0A3M0JU07_HIRRU|nr:hypothetical protein DUI87_18870 [Hirundo rustica rustica]